MNQPAKLIGRKARYTRFNQEYSFLIGFANLFVRTKPPIKIGGFQIYRNKKSGTCPDFL